MTLNIADIINDKTMTLAELVHLAPSDVVRDAEYQQYIEDTTQDWFELCGVDANTPEGLKDLLAHEVREDMDLLVALNRPLLEFYEWFVTRGWDRFAMSQYHAESLDPYTWGLDAVEMVQQLIASLGVAVAAETPFAFA